MQQGFPPKPPQAIVSAVLPASTAPSQAAWCSVTNLVAVALDPEPDSSTASILLLDPAQPDDCTTLELPLKGNWDRIVALSWSWAGQRRALLTATASGAVVVWTQLQQHDEATMPRCLDEWHGQLVLPAPAVDGGVTDGAAGTEAPQPAIACALWLPPPPGGRVWSSASMRQARLEGQDMTSLFCDIGGSDIGLAGPHWVRPHQLMAAVLTPSGSLTIVWALYSKLSNTIDWQRTRPLQVPVPDGELLPAVPNASRVVAAALCPSLAGGLTLALVYAGRPNAVFIHDMQGNPTLCVASDVPPGGPAPPPAAPQAPSPRFTLPAVLTLPPLELPHTIHRVALTHTGLVQRAIILAAPEGGVSAAGGGGGTGSSAAGLYGFVEEVQVVPGAGAAPGPDGTLRKVLWSHIRTLMLPGAQPAADGAGGAAPPHLKTEVAEGAAGAAGAAQAQALQPAPSSWLAVSPDGSKLVATHGGGPVLVVDTEALCELAALDVAAAVGRAQAPNSSSGPLDHTGAPATAASEGSTVLGGPTLACLSANSCCMCAVSLIATSGSGSAGPPPATSTAADYWWLHMPGGPAALKGGGPGGAPPGMLPDPVLASLEGGVLTRTVVLQVVSVPDVPHSGLQGGPEPEARASLEAKMDTLRMAWGALQRTSLWDVGERAREAWLGGRCEQVLAALDALDSLLLRVEDNMLRSALSPVLNRAKVAVLRRLQGRLPAVVCGDLLVGARLLQYSQLLLQLPSPPQQIDPTLAHPDGLSTVAHMLTWVLELVVLTVAALKLWVEATVARWQAGGHAPGPGAPLAEQDLLPLVRMAPDYNMLKVVMLFMSQPQDQRTASTGTPQKMMVLQIAQLPPLKGLVDERLLAQSQAAVQVLNRVYKLGMGELSRSLPQPSASGEGADALRPGQDLPAALVAEQHTLFPGRIRVTWPRLKGLVNMQVLQGAFTGEEMAKSTLLLALTRAELWARITALGLPYSSAVAQPVVDVETEAYGSGAGGAQVFEGDELPHAAARRLWRSFRAPAPPAELHAHVLSAPVSHRQHRRAQRQRAAAFGLGATAAQWSHSRGPVLDCLTCQPLPVGSSWALETAGCSAVTAQMGPGVGAAASRRGLPALLASAQRAWVCTAPPTELSAPWKRARLGLQQDMEY